MLRNRTDREKAEKRAKAEAKRAATAPHLRPREKVVAASAKPTRRGREPRTQEAPPMQAGVIRIPDRCGDCEHYTGDPRNGVCGHAGHVTLLLAAEQKPPRACPLRPRFCERCNARIESGSLCSPCAEKATPPVETTTARTRGRASPKAGGLDSKTLRDWYRDNLGCACPEGPEHPIPCRRPTQPPHHHHSTGSHGNRRQDILNILPTCFVGHRNVHNGVYREEALAMAVVNAFDQFTRLAPNEVKVKVVLELFWTNGDEQARAALVSLIEAAEEK